MIHEGKVAIQHITKKSYPNSSYKMNNNLESDFVERMAVIHHLLILGDYKSLHYAPSKRRQFPE
jgi:hypothetical protein